MEEKENQNLEQNSNSGKKSGKGIFIVVGILLIIIIALVCYIVFGSSTNQKEQEAKDTNTTTSREVEKEKSKDSKEQEDEDEDDEEDEDDKDNKKDSKKKDKNVSKNTSNETNTSSSSKFGKKKKDSTNTENTTTNTTSNTTTEEKDSSKTTETTTSSDWKSGEFVFDGIKYKINDDYKKYVDNGWSVDLSKYGYEDGYILNKNDKTSSTVTLTNSEKYDEKTYVNIGFINLSDSAKDVTESQVWAISVDNVGNYRTKVDFELPGGIKYGSTLAEVEAAYGKPEDESDIYRSEDLKYTSYTYSSREKNTPQLRLVIYDEEGLVEFDYKQY